MIATGREPTAAIATDWAVAEIPTPPIANHPGGIPMPLRWLHHGDLRILVDDPAVFVAADDIHELAEIDADEPHPTIRPTVTWARRPGDPLVAMYALAEAVTVLEHNPTHQTLELLQWMRDQLPLVLEDEVLDFAVGLEAFCDSFTVKQAAMILDRDPAVSIGRQSLFEHLELIGWASRDLVGHWRPMSAALRGRYLTVREVLIRPRTKVAAPYPQLYVTKTGLAELRRTLHALHTDPAELPEPEQLSFPE